MQPILTLLLVAVLTTAGCAGYKEGSNERTPGEVIDDSTIQAAVKTALLKEPGVEGLAIDTEVRRGTVRLYGRVASEAVRQRVLSRVGRIDGVKHVDDRLVVVP